MIARAYRLALAVALPLSLCASMETAAAGAPTKPSNHTVVIDGVRFEPEALTVKVGDTVTWINKDPFPHTATSQSGGFDSKEIAPGQSWRYTATRPGVFPYLCSLHPTMKATLTVQ